MAQTLNIELLQLLEDKLGKEEGRKVAEAIEIGLGLIEKKAEAVALQKKLELKDELTKELATKADLLVLREELFGETKSIRQEMQTINTELGGKMEKEILRLEGKIEVVRQEMQTIRQEMQTINTELGGKMEKEILRLEGKIEVVRQEMQTIRQEMQTIRQEMQTIKTELDRKFTIMFIILFFTLIFLNQNALEFIFRVLGVIK
jgi:predicted nuclease with TOPRIM domain